jgi:hypothetical protein
MKQQRQKQRWLHGKNQGEQSTGKHSGREIGMN